MSHGHEYKFTELYLVESLIIYSHYAWGPMITLHNFGNVLGWPLDTSFWLPQFHVHSSWLVREVAPIIPFSACATNSQKQALFYPISKSTRVLKNSLSDTKFMNTCSFNIHFKIITEYSNVFLEHIINFCELKDASSSSSFQLASLTAETSLNTKKLKRTYIENFQDSL